MRLQVRAANANKGQTHTKRLPFSQAHRIMGLKEKGLRERMDTTGRGLGLRRENRRKGKAEKESAAAGSAGQGGGGRQREGSSSPQPGSRSPGALGRRRHGFLGERKGTVTGWARGSRKVSGDQEEEQRRPQGQRQDRGSPARPVGVGVEGQVAGWGEKLGTAAKGKRLRGAGAKNVVEGCETGGRVGGGKRTGQRGRGGPSWWAGGAGAPCGARRRAGPGGARGCEAGSGNPPPTAPHL